MRAKLDGAEVPYALVIDSERRPLGWLSDDDLLRETVPARPDTSPEPMVELDDVMRDALSDLLQAETRYAPVVDAEGRIAGVLSVEIVSEFLTSDEALTEEHSGGRAGGHWMNELALHVPAVADAAGKCAPGLPASFCHHHSLSGCVGGNGFFCFGWAADNFDRYVNPFFRHLEIVAISVVAGFVIAMALAIASHRYRALAPPILGITGVLYTVPSIAFFFLLLPMTGLRRSTTAIIPLSAYTLQIIYRNTLAGLANVPPGAKDAGRGMGMTAQQLLWRVELPLAAPEIVAGLRIATVSTVAIATLASLAGAGGLGDPLFEQIQFKTNIIIVGALAVGMALALDLILLLVQRFATPWRKARTW